MSMHRMLRAGASPTRPAARSGPAESGPTQCPHSPPCPSATAVDRDAARVTADHCEQGWRLLCNGVIAFDDGGDLLPDGHSVRPQLAGWVTHAA